MMHTLLLSFVTLTMLTGIRVVRAQSILAGQIANVAYTDLIPDKVLEAQQIPGTLDTELQYLLDFDSDGTSDVKIISHVRAIYTIGQSGLAYCEISPLHNNVSLHSSIPVQYSKDTFDGGLTKVLYNHPISSTILPYSNTGQGRWNNEPATIGSYPGEPFILSKGFYGYNSPNGLVHIGFWGDIQDYYLPIRLRSSNSATWRYGWVRLQVLPEAARCGTTYMKVTIKDYALSNAILETRPAQAASWQAYPTQVTEQLTIEPPAGANQVTVFDLYGRPVLRAALNNSRQQLNLSSLSAGVYLVQLITPAGHYMQRIIKQ